MSFDLTDEQRALQEVLHQLCLDRFGSAVARRWGEPGGADPDRWRDLAQMGVLGLATGDDTSGTIVDAVVAFETLGQHLVPGPLLGSALAAGIVDGAAEGTVPVALVEPRGHPLVVSHLEEARAVLVLGDDVQVVEPSAVDAVAVTDPLDPTARTFLVEHLPSGTVVGGDLAAVDLRRRGGLIVAALLLGLSQGATDLAVGHAKDRQQFGQPIGSFQALKHLLADCRARTELARASVQSAAVMLHDDLGSAGRALAGARHVATSAAHANAKAAVQVLGGMGFTWEVDAHLYVKRTWVLQSTLGSAHQALEDMEAYLEPMHNLC